MGRRSSESFRFTSFGFAARRDSTAATGRGYRCQPGNYLRELKCVLRRPSRQASWMASLFSISDMTLFYFILFAQKKTCSGCLVTLIGNTTRGGGGDPSQRRQTALRCYPAPASLMLPFRRGLAPA